MVAVGNKNYLNNIFSRFIYTCNSTFSNNMEALNSNYDLFITTIFIKNNETILALFYDGGGRIIFGEIDMANYTFSLKQTLPKKNGDIKRAIILDGNQYIYGVESSSNFNTLF